VLIVKTLMRRFNNQTSRLVWGRADETTDEIFGVCTPILGGNGPVLSEKRYVEYVPACGQKAAFVRWLIVFRNLEKGVYLQTITGLNASIAPTGIASPAVFAVSAFEDELEAPRYETVNPFCSISEPPTSNVSIAANDFIAYGDTSFPLVSLSLYQIDTVSGANVGNPVPNSHDWDYMDLHFWSAHFDPLVATNQYHLHAEDQASADDKTNLTAN
jgi:hypothetical protein